jgi:putative endonuclease
MPEKQFFVYLMASRKGGPIYIGVTSSLVKSVYEHKQGIIEGFTKRYNIKRLVCFEAHASAEAALMRETQMKTWKREWKVELIEASNKEWRDLYETIL